MEYLAQMAQEFGPKLHTSVSVLHCRLLVLFVFTFVGVFDVVLFAFYHSKIAKIKKNSYIVSDKKFQITDAAYFLGYCAKSRNERISPRKRMTLTFCDGYYLLISLLYGN